MEQKEENILNKNFRSFWLTLYIICNVSECMKWVQQNFLDSINLNIKFQKHNLIIICCCHEKYLSVWMWKELRRVQKSLVLTKDFSQSPNQNLNGTCQTQVRSLTTSANLLCRSADLPRQVQMMSVINTDKQRSCWNACESQQLHRNCAKVSWRLNFIFLVSIYIQK